LAGSVSPSHAYIHVVEFNLDVTVMGMKVKHNDLIHADQHGAVVIPIEVAGKVKAAAEKIAAQEAIIISAAREPGFDINRLRQAWKGDKEIH
jgi:regulator of RNase E activity RraA